MTFPGLVRANNLNDIGDQEKAWDNLGNGIATGDISIPTPSLDLNFAANKSLIDNISNSNLITFSRASTGTYVGSNGLIQAAASGVARFDHNPVTGESLGLLVEEARTNVIVSSQAFNSGGWILDGASLTANAAAAPDATTTATSIVQGTGSNRTFHPDNSGVTGGKVFSIFAKANAGTSLAIISIGGMSPSATATVNLSNGTVSGFTGATVQSYPNGWYRVLLPVTVSIASGSSTYWQILGPASSVYIWGAQLEAGSFPTSYIPTVASTVTRAADVASITGANFSSWYNPAEGTFFTSARQFTGYGQAVLGLGSGSGSMYQGAISAEWWNGSSLLATSNAAVWSDGVKIAGSYTSTNRYLCFNAGVVVSNVSTLPNGGLIRIGAFFDGSGGYTNGTISRLTYWPSRLNNNALQDITDLSVGTINLYSFSYSVKGKDVLALNGVRNTSSRDFIFIKGLLSTVQPRLSTAFQNTSSAVLLNSFAMPKLAPTTSGNYFFSTGLALSGVTTRINGTNARSIATSPFAGSTATAPLLFRELRPQANWRITEPMASGTIASPSLVIPFETNDYVLFIKAGQN